MVLLDTNTLKHPDRKSKPPAVETQSRTLTSQPFRVVLDGAENRAAFSQAPVNHSVARQEVRHGGRVEIATWGDRGHGQDRQLPGRNGLLSGVYSGHW